MRCRYLTILSLLCLACTKPNEMVVNGWTQKPNTEFSIATNSKTYDFLSDSVGYFSAVLPISEATYAKLVPYNQELYLIPGESLEIIMSNAGTTSRPFFYNGSLGKINGFLRGQKTAITINADKYKLAEEEFVQLMNELKYSSIRFLEAKQFDIGFTEMERERINYRIAAIASYWPFLFPSNHSFKPEDTPIFNEFINSFDINNSKHCNSESFLTYVNNLLIFRNWNKPPMSRFQDAVSLIHDYDVRDAVLSHCLYSYIEENGVKGTEDLLRFCEQYISDFSLLSINLNLIERMSNLENGKIAPYAELIDIDGNEVTIGDFSGKPLALIIWQPTRSNQRDLQRLIILGGNHYPMEIGFLSINVDDPKDYGIWRHLCNIIPPNIVNCVPKDLDSFKLRYLTKNNPILIIIDSNGVIIDSAKGVKLIDQWPRLILETIDKETKDEKQ